MNTGKRHEPPFNRVRSPTVLPDLRSAGLDPHLLNQLTITNYNEHIRVLIEMRDFPDWNIPLLPRPGTISAADLVRLAEDRDDEIAARKELLSTKSLFVTKYINTNGGRVVRSAWTVGYLVADLPAGVVLGLLDVPNVVWVELSLMPENKSLGEFYIGDQDLDSRTDGEDFFNEGYEGGQPNTARHGQADMVAAVIESNYFEDEACSFQEGANNCGDHSTDRILGRWDCDDDSTPECGGTADFTATQEEFGVSGCYNGGGSNTASHGTIIATLIAGDYTQGQGDGEDLGDPAWTTGAHTTSWEKTSSGNATEALLLLLGGRCGCNDCSQSALQVTASNMADVANISWGMGGECNEASSRAYEDELENAYDDGVFIVASAGNNSGPSSSSCNIETPADTPKAFAVNGLGTQISACEANYQDCATDTGDSARGGGLIDVNGAPRAAAFVDITAPAELRRRTSWKDGYPNGYVYETYVGGTSIAAPVVATSGLTLKDFMLSQGHSFINNPGRLQAMMLAMGDSWHDDSGVRAESELDDLSGAGRLKMRLFDPDDDSTNEVASPWQWRMRTNTFTTTGTTTFFLNDTTPMQSGTTFAKCVLWEGEDMSVKTDVSDVYLLGKIRKPVAGACDSSGVIVDSNQDTTWDIRHMMNFSSSLAGNCLEVSLVRNHVTGAGTTVNAFCYSAGETDYEN